MAKNRYFKTTKGFNGEVIVAKGVAYTTDATYADFVANAVEGEIGVFNADTYALISGDGLLPAPGVPSAVISTVGGTLNNVHYFVKITALNAAGETTGSPELDVNVTDAGDTNSVQLSWDPVTGATGYRVYYGLSTGAQDKYYEVNGTSFTLTVDGGAADTVPTTNTATSASADAIAAGTKVFIAQKRDSDVHKSAPFVVSSGIGTYTAYQAPVKDVWTVTPPAVTAGDIWELVFIETTPVNQPFPTWNFDMTIKSGETLANAIIRMAGYINDLTIGQNYMNGQAFVATYTGTTLILTAEDFGRHFRVILRQKLADGSVAHTTPFKAGVGTYDNVANLEDEGIIFSGTTTNYPIHGIPSEYGGPTRFADSSLGYNLFTFAPWMDEYSPLPVDRHFHKKITVVAVPSTGTSPNAALASIFGFSV